MAPDVLPSPRRPRPSPRFTLALIGWALFALAIAVNTLAKRDTVAVEGQRERLVGTILRRDAAGVTVRVRGDDGRTEDRTVPAELVRNAAPYGERSVTGVYRGGSELWWSRGPLYTEGPHGFLYLPQAAMIFTPFAALPPAVGEVLWRWVGIGACAWGLWRLCRGHFGGDAGSGLAARAFLAGTVCCIPALVGSAQNGQTNLVMGGLFALVAADAGAGRRWRTTLWLMLLLACKPVALPVLLLLGAVKPRLIAPMLAGLAAFALAPLLHYDPAWAWSQYGRALGKIAAAGGQEAYIFYDVRGMLMDFGLFPDAWPACQIGETRIGAMTVLRAAAAGVALALCLSVAWRAPWLRGALGAAGPAVGPSGPVPEPSRSCWVVLAGVLYILVFSPRTEGVTYAMLGPLAGLLAARELVAKRWVFAAPLVVYCFLLQFSLDLTRPLDALLERLGHLPPGSRDHKYWLRPLCTLVVWGFVAALMVLGRRVWPVEGGRENGPEAAAP